MRQTGFESKESPDPRVSRDKNRQLGWLVDPIHGNLLLNTPKNPSPVLATLAFSQNPYLKKAGQSLNRCSSEMTERKRPFLQA